MAKSYDYLIVGSGLFGAVFAHEALKKGKKCLVIDKRKHLGGNIYTENIEGINVHKYGPHIFHTNDESIWNYVNKFISFNHFIYSPIANYKGGLYNLPFNMNTFSQLWKVSTPQEAQDIIQSQIRDLGILNPRNLEEQALKLVGVDIYEKLIKGYTEKQWGKSCAELPPSIIKRIPVRFTFDNNYFNDRFQGIPIGGYTKLIEAMLERTECRLNADFFENKTYWTSLAKKVVYTGGIDTYFNYRLGELEYRSLKFKTKTLEISNYQGVAGMNFTDDSTPYTRIIEHKHFEFGKQENSIITEEYPLKWEKGKEPYYPINDERNDKLFRRYREMADNEKDVIFGGRLAEYRYYDMHQVIASALKAVQKEII